MSSHEHQPQLHESPWADEVDGVPTGAVARHDDEDAIVSTEVSETHTKLSGAGVERGTTTTVKEGDKKQVDETKTKVGYAKKTGSIGRTKSHETEYSEKIKKKDTTQQGVDAGAGGGHVTWSKESELQAGDHKKKTGAENKVGWKDGHIDAERKTTHKTEDEHGSRAQSTSYGLEGGKLKVGTSDEKEHKRTVQELGADGKVHDVEKTSSKGTETSIKVGRDGAGFDHSWTNKNENGTARKTTVGAELDKDGNASLTGSHTITDKSGRSVSVSAHAGVQVVCSEPKQVGQEWVVTYSRTKSVGGGVAGSAKAGPVSVGATASGSVSDFENGTRSFKTKKEADEFREHAAERIRETADPRSVMGALSMEIGESRGDGHALEGALGASVGAYGVSVGAAASKKNTDEVDVRRISANLFEVTYLDKSEADKHLSGSVPGADLAAGKKSEDHQAVTVRFDLSTPDGQKAFEQYCKDHKVPAKGGQLVSREKGKLGETYQDFSVVGGYKSHTYGKTWENDLTDEKGHHEEYGGERGQDISAGWIGHNLTHDKDMHYAMDILSRQENDKEAGYALKATFGGESGEYIRGKMQHLGVGYAENWDHKDIEGHASGEWSMSADIDPKAVAKLAKNWQRLQGKSLDDQMRELAQYVADKGIEGVRKLEPYQKGGFQWDIELKGDKNFPGRAGREETETKIVGYTALLDASHDAGGATVVGQLDGEMVALEARRAAVADPKRYLDLPDGLRSQQLATIDDEIGKFEMLRHRAAIAAMKNNPGETTATIGARQSAKDGYKGMTPQQKELAQLRDQIAQQDAAIIGYEQQSAEAQAALYDAVGHYTDWGHKDAKELAGTQAKRSSEARTLTTMHGKQYLKIDELRMSFIRSMDDPQAAIGYGKELLRLLNLQASLMATASTDWFDAAKAQRAIMKDSGLAQHSAFWADVSDTMDPEDFHFDDGPDVDAAAPMKPLSMALGKDKEKDKRTRHHP
jgi:hypothetical protein